MSLRSIKLQGLGPRLIIWTTLLLSISLVSVSTIVYYLMSESLRKSDQELIVKLSQSYAHTYLSKGVDYLTKDVSPEVIISIVDNDGKEILSLLPEYIDRDFEDEEELEQIRKATRKIPLKEGWTTILLLSGEENDDFFHVLEYKMRKFVWKRNWTSILPLIDNDMAEVYTSRLDKNNWIKVGRSSEEREEHLARIRNISLIVLTPFILLGLFMSFVLSRKLLSPVQNLVRTIQRIKQGDLNARAKVSKTGDEVDQLAEEFNQLLEHNAKLVLNLKESINNVAHDLRTPLTRFRMSAETALSQTDENSLREALQDGVEDSETILQLLNAIMDIAEAETKTMNIKKEKIDLREVLLSVVDLYHYIAEDKNIAIESDLEVDLFTSGDRIRLLQAFSNLMDNALKFSGENSQIVLTASKHKEEIHITLRDEGAGIDPADMEHIWERLFRGDKSRSTKGLGIGLSVVRAIIKAHEGEIYVSSQHGEGTTFTVTLPICNV